MLDRNKQNVSIDKQDSKKRKMVFVALLSLVLLLAGCGSTEDNSGNSPTDTSPPSSTEQDQSNEENSASQAEIIVQDAMGNEVTVPANPERIIASYLEDHLITLGVIPVAQWSVAAGVQDYLQDELKDIPTIGYDLPLEEVMSFDPDFHIIGTESQVESGLYEQYSKISPTYVLGSELNDDWRKALLKIGELLGKTTEAELALKDYEEKATSAKNKLLDAVGEQSVAILWLTNKTFFIVSEGQSSGAVVYGDLGMAPPNLVSELPDDKKANWNPVSLEKLAELDADHIFLINSDKDSGSEALQEPIWQNIPAVKEGNVYEMDRSKSWLYKGYIAGLQIMDDVLEVLIK